MQNTIYTPENIPVIFEDKDILVIKKPVGILSEDSQKGEKGILSYLENDERKTLHLLHRLDREVGGVMVIAKNKKSASFLSTEIANGGFKKEYLAVTDGIPQEDNGVFEDLLYKDSKKNRSYVVKRERKGVKKASLEYEVLEKEQGKALVKVLLHTGRTHQIRVQFSSRKMPLTGDGHYGSGDRGCKIALHSHRVSFLHPQTKKAVAFESMPDAKNYPWSLFGGLKND
ncbi:MAG: RluA family pseudouridine synthase [Clostridia bacterium]|nr:RluA family pseudouridine synthase [Clostridia bacterium]